MSDKCEWCGLTAEHESRICVFKDDSIQRMEINLCEAPLNDTMLQFIKMRVEDEQAEHGKRVELTIRNIGYWGKSPIEQVLPLQRDINQALNPALNHYKINEGGAVEHSHGTFKHVPLDEEGFAQRINEGLSPHLRLRESKFHRDECEDGLLEVAGSQIPASGTSDHDSWFVAAVPLSDTWLCANHLTPVPDIPRGEKCPICGAVEAN